MFTIGYLIFTKYLDLSRVLSLSHDVGSKRQSNASSYSNHDELGFSNFEPQSQITAEVMQQNLLCIGESCIGTTGQIMAWALKTNNLSIANIELDEVSVLAEQVLIVCFFIFACI